jgi:hypothetical protein
MDVSSLDAASDVFYVSSCPETLADVGGPSNDTITRPSQRPNASAAPSFVNDPG